MPNACIFNRFFAPFTICPPLNMTNHTMNTYLPQPISFERGEGAVLFDTEGKAYLDALGGIAVCALGHAHPAVSAAICEQSSRLTHCSNLYRIPAQEQLAERLSKLSGMQRVFFSNSGAEANEAAIKIARLYGNQTGVSNPSIIVTEGSFHGRTMATLSATGNRKVQAGFEPLVSGFVRVPHNDLEAMQTVAQNSNSVVAVLVEPITGEGGIRLPDEDYLNGVRQLCDDNGWLMMLDEIQTGMGRTGEWFAHQHHAIKPDVMTLAKALGNGMPIGACLADGKAAEVLKPGSHGSTYGGNPLACAAALAVIKTIDDEQLVDRAQQLGEMLINGFQTQLNDQAGVSEIRGRGLMIGIELDQECAVLVEQAREAGLLINVTAGNVVRLLPPYILSDAQAQQIIDGVSQLIIGFLQASSSEADQAAA